MRHDAPMRATFRLSVPKRLTLSVDGPPHVALASIAAALAVTLTYMLW
jgi:hypothetical protein